ncbi:MAG TPA: hypothetical protein ENN79_02220, partial [Desulfobacteraceae bacterium]|nr:hypothetical protein [Desulfobacteraceae bacterium]
SWTVANQGTGTGPVDTWVDRVILSRDGVLGNSDDRIVGSFLHQGLMPVGTSYTRTEVIQLAAATEGHFTLFVVVDAEDAVYEHTNIGPNVGSPDHFVDIMPRPYADMVVSSVDVSGNLTTGVPFLVTWSAANDGIGQTSKPEWFDDIYLADNPEGTGAVLLSRSSRVGNLAPGDFYSRTVEVIIPIDMKAQVESTVARYLFVKAAAASGPYEFIYTGNNLSEPVPVEVTYTVPPMSDLEIVSVSAPASASDGDAVDVTWRVVNNGPNEVNGPWTDSIYIAPNGDRSKAVRIGSFTMSQTVGAGFSYERTENFRLPVHIQGVYELFVRTDAAGVVIDPDRSNNDDEGSDITIQLKSRPDLQVVSMNIPATVTSGAVVDVEWVVANLGGSATPTGGSRWFDGVYLSLDNKFDGGDKLLGWEPNGSALMVAEQYGSYGHYRIPQAAQGPMYIIVKVDASNSVDEFPYEGNNVMARPITIDSQPVPPPDLVVSHVAGPTEVFDGSEITVNYRVTNKGAGVTFPASWTDSLWLTADKTKPGGATDFRIGSANHTGALEVGQYYEGTVTGTIPKHIQGVYEIMVYTDSWNQVFELTFDVNINPDDPNAVDNNNYKTASEPLTVLYTPPADLEVTNVVAPATAEGGEKVTISWTVANNGSNVTDLDRWADAVYVAEDAEGTKKTLVFGLLHEGALQRGQSYTRTLEFTLPPTASGKFFIVETNVDPQILLTDEEELLMEMAAVTDRIKAGIGDLETMSVSEVYAKIDKLSKSDLRWILWGEDNVEMRMVWEGPFTDNNDRAVPSVITPIPADLEVTSVSIPETAYSGETVDISWTVTNVGGSDVYHGTERWTDYVYVSPDPDFIFSRAQLVASVVYVSPHLGGDSTLSPLQAGASYTATASVTLPLGAEGRRYVHVFTDRNPESESRSGGIDGLTKAAFPDWPSKVKNRVYEGDPAVNRLNNTGSAEMSVVYREPDLRVEPGSLVIPGEVYSGELIDISWTVTNAGTWATRTDFWFDRVYISRDGSIDLYDLMIGEVRHRGVLDAGESYDVSTTVRLPDDIEGDFYLLVYIDSPYGVSPDFYKAMPYPQTVGVYRIQAPLPVSEWNLMGRVKEFADEANNIIASPISVTLVDLPDLQVTEVHFTGSEGVAPDQVITGGVFEVTYTVSNLSSGAVPDRQNAWSDYIFLSRDKFLDVKSDHFVGQVTHKGALAAAGEEGDSYTVTSSFRAPRGLLGTYYIIVLTDVPNQTHPYGFVYEGPSEGNNAYNPSDVNDQRWIVQIVSGPPTDLAVQEVTVPASADAAGTITVSYTVKNVDESVNAKGYWADSLFISDDAIWDLGDKLIGRVEMEPDPDRPGKMRPIFRDLAPGEEYTATLTAELPTVLPGDYRVIVRTDIYDDVNEGAKTYNNKLASSDTISVEVPELQMGLPHEDVLIVGKERLYQVTVPFGETLEVTLSAEDKSIANELYIRHEGLPNSIYYDAAFEGHLWSDQTATVPLTEAGTYYILVRSAGWQDAARDVDSAGVPVTSGITVKAELLPFCIREVSPDRGGDSRYVTVEVRGAKFSQSAILKLVRPQIAEFEAVNYQIVNSTRIVAVFDLEGAPHGLYDVEVINPDGSKARLPYRYLVEDAQPFSLTVGLGGPGELEYGDVGWYGFGVYSLTNVDMPYVHFEFSMPFVLNDQDWYEYVQTKMSDEGEWYAGEEEVWPVGDRLIFRTNLSGNPELDGVPWADLDSIFNLNGMLMAPGFTFDFINRGYMGLTFTADLYPEMRDVLVKHPDALRDLRDQFVDPQWEYEEFAFKFYIAAAATPMTVAEYVEYQLGVAERLRNAILDDATAPRVLVEAAADSRVWGALYLKGLEQSGQLRPEDVPPEVHLLPQISSLASIMTVGLLGIDTGGDIIREGNLVGFFAKVREWYGHDPDARFPVDTLPNREDFDLGLTHETHFEAFWVQAGIGIGTDKAEVKDPNLQDFFGIAGERSDAVRMIGPTGYGQANFVPAGTYLPYTISFENPADATEYVKRIRIQQEIDENLDVRSFLLGDIFLGDIQVHLPDYRASFSGDFDFVDELGFVLRVTAGVDVMSGIALWTFTALDPETGLVIEDPDRGLLAPNKDGSQAGKVIYTIKPWPDYTEGVSLTTGTEITASARVTYDGGTPKDTGTHRATLDMTAPVTSYQVQNLGVGATGRTTYRLTFAAEDDAEGSGVKDYSVYVSVDGGVWQTFKRRITETSVTYEAPAGSTAEFVVLAADNAGNVETAPEGVTLPPYNPGVNLGTAPTAGQLISESRRTLIKAPEVPLTNTLFIEALQGIPGGLAGGIPSGFSSVFDPFTASAFFTNVPQSGAGIGPVSVVSAPDGSYAWVSGGSGRNQLWRVSPAGGSAGASAATLDVPIFQMLFDSQGLLWASTGGGPIVRLDPVSGRIMERFGDGIGPGIALHPTSGDIYCATASGVSVFDPVAGTFRDFSSTRVHSLAFSSAGTLYGTAWPRDGHVLRFDARGNAEIFLIPPAPALGLAFGLAGTPLENLLFLSHGEEGFLTMVDMVTHRFVKAAEGGSRGGFLHVAPDGRLLVTQSDQVDVFFPVTPPLVTAMTPSDGVNLIPVVTSATVRFDVDMWDGGEVQGSVTDPEAYQLVNSLTGVVVPVSGVVYDDANRTVSVLFEPLPPGEYEFRVKSGVKSELGLSLQEGYQTGFTVITDVTASLKPKFSATRFDLGRMVVSFEAVLVNSFDFDIIAPYRLIFTGLNGSSTSLIDADGVTDDGHPYVDLVVEGGVIEPGQATEIRTLAIHNPDFLAFHLITRLTVDVGVNEDPVVTSSAPVSAQAGSEYSYLVVAEDPEGSDVSFLLIEGPAGAVLDAASGLLTWTPGPGADAATKFRVRVFDERGGSAAQAWVVSVAGVDAPPVMLPIPDQYLVEGDLLEIPVGASVDNHKSLFYWAEKLPAGAVFDPAARMLRWQTDGSSAGIYKDVRIYASDGVNIVWRGFGITVADLNQPPILDPVMDRTLEEGQQIEIRLQAEDPDGDPLTFGAVGLPRSAWLHPLTGVFTWTPGYDEHGAYEVAFTVSDGRATHSRTAVFTVLNVNGPVAFEDVDRWEIYEGQTITVQITAKDPDNPLGIGMMLDDGTVDADVLLPQLLWEYGPLPEGAAFTPGTQIFRWTPGYHQSGSYAIPFKVTDDGDGTGVPTSDETVLHITVRDANAAPVVEHIENRSLPVVEGQQNILNIPVSAFDPDGAPPTLTAFNLPSFAVFTDNGDGTGMITVSPTLTSQRGDYTITVRATDDGNGYPKAALSSEESFVLSVTARNAVPVMAVQPDRVAVVGEELAFEVLVTDPDEDPLLYWAGDGTGLSGLPSGASFTDSAIYGKAYFRWTPDAENTGVHTVRLNVTDSGNGDQALSATSSRVFTITVRAANSAPMLLPVGAKTVAEGDDLTFTIRGTDPDGDAVSYRAVSLPRGATFDILTGVFFWTPGFTQAGTHKVRFTATDGMKSSSEDVTITVTNTNRAPVFVPIRPMLTYEGTGMQLTVAAGDLDGDMLSYGVASDLPRGASFDPANQLFTWVPGYDQ